MTGQEREALIRKAAEAIATHDCWTTWERASIDLRRRWCRMAEAALAVREEPHRAIAEKLQLWEAELNHRQSVIEERERLDTGEERPPDPPRPERMCLCGHTDHWHGDIPGMHEMRPGEGRCEHNGDCGCGKFVAAREDTQRPTERATLETIRQHADEALSLEASHRGAHLHNIREMANAALVRDTEL